MNISTRLLYSAINRIRNWQISKQVLFTSKQNQVLRDPCHRRNDHAGKHEQYRHRGPVPSRYQLLWRALRYHCSLCLQRQMRRNTGVGVEYARRLVTIKLHDEVWDRTDGAFQVHARSDHKTCPVWGSVRATWSCAKISSQATQVVSEGTRFCSQAMARSLSYLINFTVNRSTKIP